MPSSRRPASLAADRAIEDAVGRSRRLTSTYRGLARRFRRSLGRDRFGLGERCCKRNISASLA